jgi:hypothetical protein
VASVLTPTRISRGRGVASELDGALARASQRHGVPGEIIIAILGIESNYGVSTGSADIFRVLATLAWSGHRSEIFLSEFIAALTILQNGDASRSELRGSWAGAMGQPQFMPSAYLKYAESNEGGHAPDIWRSREDAIASVANFLEKSGWRADLPAIVESRLPENYENIVWEELSGNTNIYAIQLLKRKWEEEKKLLETEDGIKEYLRLKERDEVIVWNKVCKNHSAISLLRTKIAEEKETSMDEYFRYIDSEEIDWRIDWSILSGNKGAIRLLKKKIAEENKLSDDEYDRLEEYEKIDWAVLCGNISPEAIDLLKERLRRKPSDIDWEVLSGSLNPRAIELLDANQDKIFWGAFSSNTSERAMELLKDRVLLEKRLEKEGKLSVSKKNISWIGLSRNPSIFTIA